MARVGKMKVSYCGDLGQFAFPELILSLQAQRETGALFVRRERITHKIYLREGTPFFAQSNSAKFSLWRFFAEKQKSSPQEMAKLLEKISESEDCSEQTLLCGDFISPQDFWSLQLERFQAILQDVIYWTEGAYYYQFDETLPDWMEVEFDPPEVQAFIKKHMLNGFSSAWLRKAFREKMEDVPVLTVSAKQVVEDLDLPTQYTQLVEAINGERSIESLILGTDLSVDATLSLLQVLQTFDYFGEKDKPVENTVENSEDSADLSVEAMSMVQRLEKHGQSMMDLPPFEMLSIGRIFTEEDLRKGYYTIAQNFHKKDVVDKLQPELRDLSYRLFERASNFFEALVIWKKKTLAGEFEQFTDLNKNVFQRREYPKIDAEKAFYRGRTAYDNESYDDALDEFADARLLEPEDLEYRAWHAAMVVATGLEKGADALRLPLMDLRKATRDDSSNVTNWLLYAQSLEKLDKNDEAYAVYEEALQHKPKSSELREGKRRTRTPVTAKDLEAYDTMQERNVDEEKRLIEELKKMESANYFEVFDLEVGAPESEIKKQYFAMAKQYHPDHFKNTRLLETAEKIFVIINEAYDALTDKNKRRIYERSLRAMETQKSQKEMEQKISAERLLQKGKAILQANNWEKACDLFETAMAEQDDPDPRFKLYYAWALFNRDIKTKPGVRNQAEGIFLDAVGDPDLAPDAHLLLGKLYRRLELWTKAKHHFDRVLDVDTHNVEALRNLRLINQRMQQAPTKTAATDEKAADKKGIFGSLFGKRKG